MLKQKATEESLRFCCAELERKLRAGEDCRAEDFFSAYPELTADPENAIELIYAEYVVRSELGNAPSSEEYYARFPEWCEALFHQFQIHALLNQLAPGTCAGEQEATLQPHGTTSPGPWKHSPENFEILHEIARGSMGVVYKAWQKNIQRVVALKVILARSLSTPDQMARFRIEAAAIGRLIHPNIVQIYNFREWEDWPFLVLEYVDGSTLAKLWNGVPQPPSAVATLMETLAGAMEYVHQRGVVHRDLRPGNVLVGQDGTPKIIDFGLAKLEMWTHEDLTMTGQILGTPSYMAPEQIDGLKQGIGPLVDVYALGAVMYEGLTGRPPFRGKTIFDTLQEVGFKEVLPPRRVRPDVPRDLETICLKCLQKEPQRRYASAGEIANDLRRFLMHTPIQARRVRAWERMWRWCRRNQLVAGLFLTLAVVLLTGLTLVTWKWRAEVHARDDAENARTIAQEQRVRALDEKRNADRLSAGIILEQAVDQGDHGNVDYALLLLVRSLEQAIQNEDAALERAARINLTAFRPQSLRRYGAVLPPLHDKNIQALIFSADGKLIATGSDDGTARLCDVATAKPTGLVLPHRGGICPLAFSPDSKLILTVPEHGAAQLWDVSTGKPHGPPLKHEAEIEAAVFSPDGKHVMISDGGKCASWWEVASGKCSGPSLDVGKGHCHITLCPVAKFLAAASGADVQVWERSIGKPYGPPLKHREKVSAFAFGPDGKMVATGSEDGTAWLWDAASGTVHGKPLQHPGPIKSIVFSPNGKILLTWSTTNNVRLWNIATGLPLGPPMLHAAEIAGAIFTPDGQIIVVASGKSILLWDVATGKRLGPPLRHPDVVTRLACQPDGKLFATACADRLLRLWDIPTSACGNVDHIKQWVEVLTGRELCETDTLHEIDSTTLLHSRRSLEGQGSEPFPLLGPAR